MNISVITDESPEHIQSLAAHINELIDRFQASKDHFIPPNTLFIYAALELCNELFHKSDELDALRKEYTDFIDAFDSNPHIKDSKDGDSSDGAQIKND